MKFRKFNNLWYKEIKETAYKSSKWFTLEKKRIFFLISSFKTDEKKLQKEICYLKYIFFSEKFNIFLS